MATFDEIVHTLLPFSLILSNNFCVSLEAFFPELSNNVQQYWVVFIGKGYFQVKKSTSS